MRPDRNRFVIATVIAGLSLAACGGGSTDVPAVEDDAAEGAISSATPGQPDTPTDNGPDPVQDYALAIESALAVREGPGTAFARIGELSPDDRVTVECSVSGESVRDADGVLSSRWDRIAEPLSGYVAGAFIDTGGTDPDVPECTFVPDAPPAVTDGTTSGSSSSSTAGDGSGSGGATASDAPATSGAEGGAESPGFDADWASVGVTRIQEDIVALDERVGDGDWTSAARRLGMLSASYGTLYDAGTPPGSDPAEYLARVATLEEFALLAADEMRFDPIAGAARYQVIRQETGVLYGTLNGALGTSYSLP